MFRRILAMTALTVIAEPGLLLADGPAPAVDIPRSSYESTPKQVVKINVWGPADAEIWFNEEKTVQTGAFRRFLSPELVPGHEYTYDVRAKWQEDGQELTQIRRVTFRAGDELNLAFGTLPLGRATNARNSAGYPYGAHSPRASSGTYYAAPSREASPNRKVAPANEQDPMRGFGPPGFPEYQ